jgi:hypothetical protein
MTTDSLDVRAMEGRLQRLEYENRRLKRVGILALTLIVMGQVVQKNRTIEAE